MDSAFIEDLTWREVQQRFDAGHVVLLPIGAAAKAHGHHLPMQTDWLTARALAERIGQRYKFLIAPVIGLGYYPAFTRFAGSQSVAADTFKAMLVETLALLIEQGARKLALLNTGVSTENSVDAAVAEVAQRQGMTPLAMHMRLLGRSAAEAVESREGGHADERETSMMLAIAPERVRLDRATAESDQPFERSGGTGDPRRATADKGEALLAAMVDDAVKLLREKFG